ncbi:MAG TPA: alpha/beta hydrolase, partial [Ktedonobacteraceae bacterium]|nr:alpha/beta hydrolase [Ktedonobacteraceae bacterium]
APLHLHPLTRYAIRIAKNVITLLPPVREDVSDPEDRRHTRDVYRRTQMRPVESILQFLPALRSELPRITVPALIMTSIYDHMVPASDGREIYHLLGSREKHLVTFHRSHHVIMKGRDREEVFAKTYAFIRRHANKIPSQHLASLTREQGDSDQSA